MKQIVEVLFEREVTMNFQLTRIGSYCEEVGLDLFGRGCLAERINWNADAGAGLAYTR